MKEYFSHDHNARNDRKVIVLVNKYKAAGYGIFWATNEMMHEEGGELELDEMTYSAISKHLNEDEALVEVVIKDCINVFKLYFLSEGKLTSKRVKRNLTGREDKKNAKSEQAAIAGRLGGIKSGESRRTKQNEANASSERSNEAKVNESKVNESKEIKKEEVVFKKDMSKFPLAENFNGLPEKKIKASIDLIKATQNIDVGNGQINSFWEVFKIQRLTGENFYETDEKIYEHFINWIKDKKINNGIKSGSTTSNRNDGVKQLLEEVKRGVGK